MKSYTIKLSAVAEVQKFVSSISRFDNDFDLIQGKYVVDAKSILGVFSLGLQNPLELQVYAPTEEVEQAIKPFIV